MSETKKVMITVRKAPHGSIYVHEAIEVMFIVASYGMDLSVVFIDDGVFALKDGQDTKALGIKGFMASGEDEDTEEPVKPAVLDSEAIRALMVEQDSIVSL